MVNIGSASGITYVAQETTDLLSSECNLQSKIFKNERLATPHRRERG